MATWTTTKHFEFEAAHRLPGHEGKCQHMHGHTYKVEVTCERASLTESGPARGMVLDFGTMKEAWRALDEQLDHKVLNDIPGLENPTAENLAKYIYGQLFPLLDHLVEVKVWETSSSCATYRA